MESFRAAAATSSTAGSSGQWSGIPNAVGHSRAADLSSKKRPPGVERYPYTATPLSFRREFPVFHFTRGASSASCRGHPCAGLSSGPARFLKSRQIPSASISVGRGVNSCGGRLAACVSVHAGREQEHLDLRHSASPRHVRPPWTVTVTRIPRTSCAPDLVCNLTRCSSQRVA